MSGFGLIEDLALYLWINRLKVLNVEVYEWVLARSATWQRIR